MSLSLCKSCPPRTKIPYTPFSFHDISVELDQFIRQVYPTLKKLANVQEFTPEQQKLFYGFLNTKAEEFISTTPYAGYSRILTVVRNDGIVVVDKTVSAPTAIMIGGTSINNIISDITIIRQNTANPIQYPSTISPVSLFPTLKVFFNPDGSIQYYENFESFTTRTEFIQANIWTYGWATRPGIYHPGQLYCVARAIGFYGDNTISLFIRVAYNRNVS